MKVNLKYFGLIAEVTDTTGEVLDNFSGSVSDIIDVLIDKYPGLDKHSYKVAVNQQIVDEKYIINNNDEVVLLPPFAGG